MTDLKLIPTSEVTAQQTDEATLISSSEKLYRSFGSRTSTSALLDPQTSIAIVNAGGQVIAVIDRNTEDAFLEYLILSNNATGYFYLSKAKSYLNHPAGHRRPDVNKPGRPVGRGMSPAMRTMLATLEEGGSGIALLDTLNTVSDDELFGFGVRYNDSDLEEPGTPIYDEITKDDPAQFRPF